MPPPALQLAAARKGFVDSDEVAVVPGERCKREARDPYAAAYRDGTAYGSPPTQVGYSRLVNFEWQTSGRPDV